MHNRNNASRRSLEQDQFIQMISPSGFHANEIDNCISTDDTARETFRLSTFSNLSTSILADVCLVAAHGFYFSNPPSIIKCFSCGATARLSIMSDERWLRRVHYRECSFANGNDPRNKSIQERSPYENQNFPSHSNDASSAEIQHDYDFNMRESFSIQPSASSSSVHSDLAAENLVPAPVPMTRNNNVITSRLRTANFTDFQIISDQRITNFDESLDDVIPSPSPPQQQRNPELDLASIFPCNFPINPHMRSFEERLQTFFENIVIWNNHSQLLATPDELAQAGLYCLGERDRTKCWYCNGGLQNWKRDDDPWEEHAKWFPMCEFILQKKGPDYVHRIVARFPNVRRPQMLNQVTGAPQQTPTTSVPLFTNSRNLTSSGGRITSGLDRMRFNREERGGPVIVDPAAETREREQRMEDALRSSGMVTQARVMGFPESAIKFALKRQFDLKNENFTNMDEFIDAVVSAHNQTSNREAPSLEQNSVSPMSNRTSSPSSSSSRSALQELQSLTESRNCKRCRRNLACMVFIPCGHRVCCQDCQNGWDCCPICQSFIREKIRSYLS